MFVPGACGCCGCDCASVDIADCPDTFDVTFTGIGAVDPECTQDFTYTIFKEDLDSDDVADAWQGGEPNFISITLFCSDGRWILSIGADNFPAECPVLQALTVDLGCQCPATGTYETIDINGDPSTVVVA